MIKVSIRRTTSSIFKESTVNTFSELFNIINTSKCKGVTKKIPGIIERFKTKATEWGIGNEQLARKTS